VGDIGDGLCSEIWEVDKGVRGVMLEMRYVMSLGGFVHPIGMGALTREERGEWGAGGVCGGFGWLGCMTGLLRG